MIYNLTMTETLYKFRRHDKIGEADAESDIEYLTNCFVDTGDLRELLDCRKPKRIIVGRTGAGKSALIEKLRTASQNVIEIQPESLAFGYVANSNVLAFFAEAGVDLDLFFKLLWRHVFTIELIKRHYKINTEDDKIHFLTVICRGLFGGAKYKKAVEYLDKWGKSFWQETEYRIKEITTKLEGDLSASISSPGGAFSLDAAKRLSEEQKSEIVRHGQRVVNEVQIRELSEMLDLLNEALSDPQQQYFIVIDRLDENWVADSLRYRLIRSLIETVRDFRKIQNAKIVIAMRFDLLSRVFRLTRDAGFQEEKYEPLFLSLHWSREQLTQFLDARIHHLIKHAYTNQIITHRDILPANIRKNNSLEYILERTLMRPRDVILFFNQCLQQATGATKLTPNMVIAAEGEYSRLRLRSLADEWFADYPNLYVFSEGVLKLRPKSFRIMDIPDDVCENISCEIASAVTKQDVLSQTAADLMDGKCNHLEFRKNIFSVFYNVGLISLKLGPLEPFLNPTTGRRNISTAEITDESRVRINPTFHRVFGVKDPDLEDDSCAQQG